MWVFETRNATSPCKGKASFIAISGVGHITEIVMAAVTVLLHSSEQIFHETSRLLPSLLSSFLFNFFFHPLFLSSVQVLSKKVHPFDAQVLGSVIHIAAAGGDVDTVTAFNAFESCRNQVKINVLCIL
jgi:hypothetical protein